MHPILRNTLAVLAGILTGSAVNMGLIILGPILIPPPDGADTSTMEGLASSMHLFEPKHFLFPFLAHALGTLVGAAITSSIALKQKRNLALLIAALFFIGGSVNVMKLPAPLWFDATDLVLAYFPMGLLGWYLTRKV